MTQPSEQAMAAARKLCVYHVDIAGRPVWLCQCVEFAAVLEAYAAERVAETHDNFRGTVTAMAAERDAAIARAQTAEDVAARYTSSAALQNAVVDRLAVAEERVRVLETALEQIHDYCYGEYREGEKGYQPAIVARAALAKTAGGQEAPRG